MRFTKEELQFLEIYAIGADSKIEFHDKVQIIANKEKNTVKFTQMSDQINFVTEIPKQVDKDFEIIIPIVQLNNLLKLSGSEEIELTEDKIKLGDGSTYELSKYDFSYTNIEDIINNLNDQKTEHVYKVNDLEKLNFVKNYMGEFEIDKALNTIALINNHFVASDRRNVIGAVKSNNNIDNKVYLSEKTVKLLSICKLSTIELSFYDGYYTFELGGVKVIVNIIPYILPDIFDENISKKYMHPYEVSIDKKELNEALKRIKVVASSNNDGRIYITFKENILVIESKEEYAGYAIEKVQADVPAKVVGQEIIVSIHFLMSIISVLSDDLIIKIDEYGKDFVAIAIKDIDDSKLFVYQVYRG